MLKFIASETVRNFENSIEFNSDFMLLCYVNSKVKF